MVKFRKGDSVSQEPKAANMVWLTVEYRRNICVLWRSWVSSARARAELLFFFPSDQGILRRFRIADCRNCRRQEKFDVPHEGTTCFSLGRKEIGHTEREVCHCGSKLAGGLQRSKQRRKGPPQEEVSGADGKNYWQEETLWLLEGFGTRKPLGARGSPVLFIDSTRKIQKKNASKNW